MASYIGKWSYISGFLILVTLLFFLLLKVLITSEIFVSNLTLQKALRAFTTAVAVVIVSVPEGLPLAVSMAMAFSVDYMKRDNLLVKKMASVETLGYIKDICTGKTATLTQDDQQVISYYAGETQYDVKEQKLNELNDVLRDTIIDCIVKNCDARVEMSEEGNFEPVGNGTECAMLHFLQENEISV